MTTSDAATAADGRAEQTANRQLLVLAESASRLVDLVERLGPDDLRRSAYPTEWTVADVLSHLGSGAVITRERLDAALEGTEQASDAATSVWDEWNAKSPEDQAAGVLAADRALLERLAALGGEDRRRFRTAMGPLELDFVTFLGFRVHEHVVHTWDVDVTFDPAATLASAAAAVIFETLGVIAGFAGKPTGTARTITVDTTAPTRSFDVVSGDDGVTLTAGGPGAPDLELPAEAFVRLVYGRLDPDHTPPVRGDAAVLDELRRTFPGV
jgi:uncharacterized protein (TIGR03083 family)